MKKRRFRMKSLVAAAVIPAMVLCLVGCMGDVPGLRSVWQQEKLQTTTIEETMPPLAALPDFAQQDGQAATIEDAMPPLTDTPEEAQPWMAAAPLDISRSHIVAMTVDGEVVSALRQMEGTEHDWESTTAVAAGGCVNFGLQADGTVREASFYELKESQTADWREITAISASYFRIAGLKSDGTVILSKMADKIGGLNKDGTIKYIPVDEEFPEALEWTDMVAISLEEEYILGLRADKTVALACREDAQIDLTGLEDWEDIIGISAGTGHAVGLREDGTVVAAGENADGQCDVEQWTEIVYVAAGDGFTVGLRADGTVVATGENLRGQCNVSSWQGIAAIAAGHGYCVGVRKDGTVVTAGDCASSNSGVDPLVLATAQWKNIGAPGQALVERENSEEEAQNLGYIGTEPVACIEWGERPVGDGDYRGIEYVKYYGADDLLLKEVVNVESVGGNGVNEYIYTYEDGRVTRMDFATTSSYCGYDEYHYEGDTLKEIHHWVNDWDTGEPTADGITLCTADSQGNILKKQEQDRTTTGNTLTTYEYDDQGRCTRQVSGDRDYRYSYDADGNTICAEYYWNDELQDTVSCEYDSSGNLISWTGESSYNDSVTHAQVTITRDDSGRILHRSDVIGEDGKEITVSYYYSDTAAK